MLGAAYGLEDSNFPLVPILRVGTGSFAAIDAPPGGGTSYPD
jgi:hypothetical protein